MIPNKFNIVDFGGFDLVAHSGEAVPGIYDRIVGSHWNCVYIMCFGLKFAGFNIAPQYMTPEITEDVIKLGRYISIDRDDVITVNLPPPEPAIIPGIFEENGTFTPPSGFDGFAPVTVNVEAGEIGENVLLTQASGISELTGKCVAYGGVCRANLRIATNALTNKIFLIPDGYKPKIPTLLYYGFGGSAAPFLAGLVLTNGDAQIFEYLAPDSYRFLSCEWMFSGTVYPVTADSGVVSSIEGGVLVRDNVAFLSAYVKMSVGSNNWQNIITIPSEVRPTSAITPTIYTARYNPYIRDSGYSVSEGRISTWRADQIYDNNVLIQATWIIE